MKRHNCPCPNSAAGSSSGGGGKSKMHEENNNNNSSSNMHDELFEVLGYKIRSSDMYDVAEKLEQLEQVMGNTQNDTLSQLASDTVHFNPSDLSSWLQTMLSELNPSSSLFAGDSRSPFFDESDYDLTAITGRAVLESSNKRVKISNEADSTRSLVLVGSQENGIRLVHTLMACAEAVQQNNLNLAEALVKQVGFLAVSQVGAMRKVATYFAEALARRIYGLTPQSPIDHSMEESMCNNFYESCPYLKFAHFTANQAILEAFEGKKFVHVVDFGVGQGLQWPALMQALALRPGGPPAFRLTGIGPPAQDGQDHLQEVGWKLAQLAETIHVKFEYRGFAANSLSDLNASMLNIRPSGVESVAVNSVFELHKLLARPGAIDKVLQVVKDVKPEIVTIVEQEGNHNVAVFLERFTESLHYYSTMFDSLEGSVVTQDNVMSEVYLGRQICNVVACEGLERVERHEPLAQWKIRFGSAGFEPVHLGSNAYKQASMLLALFTGGDGYRVEENNGCLMLGWHTRPLIATSAWRLGVQ